VHGPFGGRNAGRGAQTRGGSFRGVGLPRGGGIRGALPARLGAALDRGGRALLVGLDNAVERPPTIPHR